MHLCTHWRGAGGDSQSSHDQIGNERVGVVRVPVVSGRPLPTAAWAGFDRVLELLEQRRLSVTELRVLVGLVEREATVPELAAALGSHSGAVSHTARRLAVRGLVRRSPGSAEGETVIAITSTGLATVRPLLAAAAWQSLA
jgi:DNA-binding MarR family transcriptional regulator